MQLGIIGVVLAAILGGGFLFFSGTNDPAEKEAIMQKEVMEKEAMTEGGVMTKDEDEDADEIEKNMMEKDGSMMKEDAMKKDGAMMEGEAMKQKVTENAVPEKETMMEKDVMTATKGSIQDYSPEKLALAEKGKVLLFFHANWCPICRGLDAEAAANPNIVPDGITVLKVDFDTATALRQKYGVTVQHTFVQVDASGNSIKKFSDASKYATVFTKVQ